MTATILPRTKGGDNSIDNLKNYFNENEAQDKKLNAVLRKKKQQSKVRTESQFQAEVNALAADDNFEYVEPKGGIPKPTDKVITKATKAKSFNFNSPAWVKSIKAGTGIAIAPANGKKLIAHGVSLGLGTSKTLGKYLAPVLAARIAKYLCTGF